MNNIYNRFIQLLGELETGRPVGEATRKYLKQHYFLYKDYMGSVLAEKDFMEKDFSSVLDEELFFSRGKLLVKTGKGHARDLASLQPVAFKPGQKVYITISKDHIKT